MNAVREYYDLKEIYENVGADVFGEQMFNMMLSLDLPNGNSAVGDRMLLCLRHRRDGYKINLRRGLSERR